MMAQWFGLGMDRDASAVFEAAGLRTDEAAGSTVVGIPKHGDGHHLLGHGGVARGGCRDRHQPAAQPELKPRPVRSLTARPAIPNAPVWV